jgi:hypothetical protein
MTVTAFKVADCRDLDWMKMTSRYLRTMIGRSSEQPQLDKEL